MEIRFAVAKDVPAILNLLRQVGRVHHEGRPDLFRATAQKYSASQILAMLESKDAPIFIAEEKGEALGYCFCAVKDFSLDSVMANYKTLYIDDLCIDEGCRGQKVGTALYEAACKYAKKRKCYNVTLNVWCCNESAMKFYEKMGLKPQKIGMEKIL